MASEPHSAEQARRLVEQLRSAANQGNLFRQDRLLEAADALEASLAREAALREALVDLYAWGYGVVALSEELAKKVDTALAASRSAATEEEK